MSPILEGATNNYLVDHPTTCKGKRIRHSKPIEDDYLKMNLGRFMSLNIVKRMLTAPNVDKVYIVTIENIATPIIEHVMIFNQYPRCICPNYQGMHSGSIGGIAKYISCKHFYHMFMVVFRTNVHSDICIHSPIWSEQQLAKLLSRNPMM